jgi:hypothetical protein
VGVAREPGPRRVAVWGAVRRSRGLLMTMWGLTLLVLGLLVTWVVSLVALPHGDLALDVWAEEATGVVAGDAAFGLTDRRGRTVHILVYSFQAARGSTHRSSSLTRDGWQARSLAQQQQVTVEYLPQDPRISRVRDTRQALAEPQLLALPLLVSFGGWALLWIGALRWWRQRELLLAGHLCTGRVTGLFDLQTGAELQESRGPARVEYLYRTGDGQEHPGVVTLRWATLGRRRLGETFTVVRRGHRHLPAGLLGLRFARTATGPGEAG